jgi:glutaconate CoA-transferase subunit B
MDLSNLGGKPVSRGSSNGAGDGQKPLPFYTNPDAQPPSAPEIMAWTLAQALRNEDAAIFGAASLLPLAACRLAQLTHAPDLVMSTGPSGGINPAADPLVASVGDYANLAGEAILSFPDTVLLWAGGRFNVFFAGGMEIDQYGNANLAGTWRDGAGVRGPGAAGLPLALSSGRILLYTNNHDLRTFVPRVTYISAPGWDPDAAAADDGPARTAGGPVLVITPLAVCDFAPSGRMRLVSVHPGVSAAQVQAATGFPLVTPDPTPTTTVPSPAVLRTLRQLDPNFLLRPQAR